MSTLEDLDDLEREERDKKPDQGDGKKPEGDGDAEMKDAEKKDEGEQLLDEEILGSSTADIVKRRRMLENELRIMKSEYQRLTHEQSTMREKVKDNQEKIENNRYVWLSSSDYLSRGLSGAVDIALSVAMGFILPCNSPGKSPYISHMLIPLFLDNYHTSSETSSNSWIWMSRLRPPKKEPISISTLPAWANRPSLRRLPARPSISPLSVW